MTTLVDEVLVFPPFLNLDALIEAKSPPDASELDDAFWAKLEVFGGIDALTNTEDERLFLFLISPSLCGLDRGEPNVVKNHIISILNLD